MTDHTAARERLCAMRERLLSDLGEQVDAGSLSLLAGVHGALAAIDVVAVQVNAEPTVRAVVSHAPGVPITLALYSEDGRLVAVELPPLRAMRLAAELIEAALPRLGNA